MDENAGRARASPLDQDDRVARRRLERLLSAACDGRFDVDATGLIVDVDETLTDATGRDREALVGAPLSMLLSASDVVRYGHLVDVVRESDLEVITATVSLETASGDRRPVELIVSPAFEAETFRGSTAVIRDVADGHTVLTTAIEDRRRTREFADQRERLEAVNSLQEVVRGITEAVIEQSTREEIERTVCRHLANSGSYLFAWIGEVDADHERFTPRASYGADAYLEEIEISIDPDDDLSNGPTGRALLSGALQTVQDVETDREYEPWREIARDHGVRSSAAAPIVHEDTVFGVLNVYADRPAAFDGSEGELIEGLGEIAGHAIAAVERKRVLMSDELLEIEVRIRDIFEDVDIPDTAGVITFDRVVPIQSEEYHVYGRATDGAEVILESIADASDLWESLYISPPVGEERRFEIVTNSSPLMETIAEHGGVVDSARLVDGDLHLTLHVPRRTDVRELVAIVREAYPTAELLARRQVTRSVEPARRVTETLTRELTDRQRVALETAYHTGFFEWPRAVSGADLADQLDIAPATFSQHLRTAERKLLDALFDELPASG